MIRESDLGAWYREDRSGWRRMGGSRGRMEEVGRRRVAFEETLFGAMCVSFLRSLPGFAICAGTYLLTFCPPGPEDRENVISDKLRGMVSGFRSASHLRAAARSSSE